jgi:hypothetical protein
VVIVLLKSFGNTKTDIMKRLFFIIFMVLITIGDAFCQKPPVTYGNVPLEDLKMIAYDSDTTAPAVVLCDYGWFDKEHFNFTRLLRIKILRKEGFPYANGKYLTMSNPSIRAMTCNLDGEEIIKEKLSGSSIYIKTLSSDIYETSFALPNVTVGSVIDMEFRYSGLPYTWNFQWMIPVRHSELIIQEADYMDISKNFFGYVRLTINEPDRWVATNVPAFKPEPYIDSPENYMTKFEIELQKISYLGYIKEFNTSWENINGILLTNISFPAESTSSLCLSPMVQELQESGLKDESLLRAAFEKVKKMKYNGEDRLFISKSGLCSKLKVGAGNSADVNMTLIQVLNRLGFKTYPVVLSTRDNGIISQFAPSLNKLNYVIVAIPSENGLRLLDATEEYMPCTILPDRCINGNGRLVNTQISQWVPLVVNGKDEKTTSYDLRFEDDMSLSGTITVDAVDYAAYDIRKAFAKFNSKEEYSRSVEKANPGLTITEISPTGIEDLYAPLQILYKVKLDGLTSLIDNEIYLRPMLYEALTENPFIVADRLYPVSYSRKVERQVNLRLALKEDMSAEVVPVSSAGKTRNGSIAYNYEVKTESDLIEVNYRFSINSLTITQDQYKDLRDIYNMIVRKHSEPIIIKTL